MPLIDDTCDTIKNLSKASHSSYIASKFVYKMFNMNTKQKRILNISKQKRFQENQALPSVHLV